MSYLTSFFKFMRRELPLQYLLDYSLVYFGMKVSEFWLDCVTPRLTFFSSPREPCLRKRTDSWQPTRPLQSY